MAFDAGALIAKLKLDTKGFQLGAQQATGQMNTMKSKAQGLSKVLGKTLAIGALGALVVGIKKTVSAAGELEKSMANVSTLVDTAVVDINELTEAVVDMTGEVLKSADDLSAGLYQVFSAGVTDSAEAMDVLRVSAIAATAGLSDTRASVDAITTIINAYGLESQQATRVSDLMFQTVKLGKTTFNELAGAIGTVIAPAASLGIELEDLFAAMATLTKGGFDTRVATTALRATFLSIAKPADDAIKLAQELGLEWSANALRAKGLVQFINDMKEATAGNIKQMSLLIPESRALTAVLALAGAQSETFNKTQKEMFQAMGSTQEAFNKQAKTYDAQKKKFGLLIDSMVVGIGNKFLPAITDFLTRINKNFEETFNLFEGLKTALETPIQIPVPDFAVKFAQEFRLVFDIFGKVTKDVLTGAKSQTSDFLKDLNKKRDGIQESFTQMGANILKSFVFNLGKISEESTRATRTIKKTWAEVPQDVKDSFDELGITSKTEFESQVRTAIGAFETIVSEQNLTNEEVLQLRQNLFNRIRQRAEQAGEEGVLGFNTQEFIQKLDLLQQNVINKSETTTKKVSETGKATTIFLKTFLADNAKLASDAIVGIEKLLTTEIENQASFLATITGEILSYKETRFAVEEAITEKVVIETERQEKILKRFVQRAKGMLFELGLPVSAFATVTAGITPVAESFAGGVDFVPRDMMANIHQGERIVPANENTFNQTVNVTAPQTSPQDVGRNIIRTFNKLNASNSF